MNLRKQAQGRPCMIRLPGCNGGGETTVLAHLRLPGLCGVGMKPDDVIGAWACSACHDAVDKRTAHSWPHESLRLAHAEGVLRTIDKLRAEGLLITKGERPNV